MFIYNRNYQIRDNILNLNIDWEKKDEDSGGMVPVEEIDAYCLESLIVGNFIDPTSRQNLSPSTAEFLDFLVKYPAARASGYALSPLRDDYRVTIDSISITEEVLTEKMKSDFIHFSQHASEIQTQGSLYAWWD